MHKNKEDKYKNIEICRFALNKILYTREAMALLNNNLPYNLIPNKFMGIFVSNKTFDEMVKIASWKATNRCLKEIIREERYILRNEKKRPWSVKTRRPFQGYIDKVEITFRDKLKLAEKVTEQIDLPIERNKRGRPPVYDIKKILQLCW